MRERTTWNRADIQKRASALSKRAEDPRAMNQDHLQRQPPADKYVTGDPSTFAEDVHPSASNWKKEYSDGSTSRNEIGMPEMRDDTFNHPETDPGSSPARGGGGRQASALDEETLIKKADVCCKVARRILGKRASEAAVEDQALAFMNLSDSDLIAMATRLANQEEQSEEEGQEKQAQEKQAQDEQEQEQAQAQDKQAKDLPPEFLENIQKKKDEAKDKDKGDKEASRRLATLDQLSSQLQSLAQQVQQMMQQQGQQQGQQVQQVQQQAPQAPMQEQQALDAMLDQSMANDEMIDQMLAQDPMQQQAPMANDFGVQLESPVMDIGEAQMGPEDDVLGTLFANNSEVQNAQVAHQLQHGAPAPMQVQAQSMARTASTRTVGTRPSGGVAQLGGLGAPAPASSGGDVAKLSNLWNSAPDVSDVFRS